MSDDFLWLSFDFPMIFLWFSYGFPGTDSSPAPSLNPWSPCTWKCRIPKRTRNCKYEVGPQAANMKSNPQENHWKVIRQVIQNYNFQDLLVFEPVTTPQHQHELSLETPGHLKTSRNDWNMFAKILFVNMRINFIFLKSASLFRMFWNVEYLVANQNLWRCGSEMMNVG